MTAQIEDSSPPGQFYCPSCEKNFQVGGECPNDGTRLMKLNVPLDPMLGRDIDGRYTILEKLGQGGMGAVYRASQHGLNREVAIKVVSPHLVTEQEVVKRFLREAKLASRLSHPNAVAVLEFGQTEDGLFYLVMELVSGRTLDQVIKSDKQLRPERVVRIGMQVCDALEGAHSLSIIHRDLKPANIMLLAKGRDLVKVLDFGLAKVVGPDQTTTTMTNAGALLGTPSFMPPELALGQPCDGRADLYSLGVVLYLAGSGRLPFESESAHELIAMHGTEAAPPMTGVPPALGAVIDRMLRKDPAERYQSAADNREALEAALEGRFTPLPGTVSTLAASNPSLAVPAQSAEFLRTPVPRGKTALGVSDTLHALDSGPVQRKKSRVLPVLGGLVLVGAVGAGAFWFVNRADTSAAPPPPVTEPTPPPQHVEPPPPPQHVVEPPPQHVETAASGSDTGSATEPKPPPVGDATVKKKHHVTPPKPPKPPVTTTTTTTTKPPPPPPDTTTTTIVTPPKPPENTTGTGSGSGKGRMPF
jgi:serine/threonine-protein kinase